MSDLVADTEKIRTAGDILQRMSDDYAEIREKFPSSDGLRGNTGAEKSFLRKWRTLRSELHTYTSRTIQNLNDHGSALKVVAGDHEALDQEIASDFGGLADDSYSDRMDDFESHETDRDETWDNRNSSYRHG
jgi:hypothetical protein